VIAARLSSDEPSSESAQTIPAPPRYSEHRRSSSRMSSSGWPGQPPSRSVDSASATIARIAARAPAGSHSRSASGSRSSARHSIRLHIIQRNREIALRSRVVSGGELARYVIRMPRSLGRIDCPSAQACNDSRRRQQTELVVQPKRLRRQTRSSGELADAHLIHVLVSSSRRDIADPVCGFPKGQSQALCRARNRRGRPLPARRPAPGPRPRPRPRAGQCRARPAPRGRPAGTQSGEVVLVMGIPGAGKSLPLTR
jgi:hypothetical protein